MQTIQKAERSVAGGGFAGAAHGGIDERATATTATPTPTPTALTTTDEPRGQKVRAMLRAQLGDDIFLSWFHTLEFESFEAGTVKFTVPVKFLRTWIQSHYSEALLGCCRAEFKGAEKVEVALRTPGNNAHARPEVVTADAADAANGARNGTADAGQRCPTFVPAMPAAGRTSVGVFEG